MTNNSNLTIESVLDELVTRLRSSEQPIAKIVLFGSHAKGTAREDSDIDVMVVIDNDVVVSTFDERMQRFLSVSRSVRPIRQQFGMDLLVYSRKELGIIKEHGSSFIKEIEQTGKILYERRS
jgi:predicted nucleotidyltransferase